MLDTHNNMFRIDSWQSKRCIKNVYKNNNNADMDNLFLEKLGLQ